jgi:hypothetical protein
LFYRTRHHMSQKVLELAIVCAEITRVDKDLDIMHATGAEPVAGTPSVADLEAVLSIAKAKYMRELRELSPDSRGQLQALIRCI